MNTDSIPETEANVKTNFFDLLDEVLSEPQRRAKTFIDDLNMGAFTEDEKTELFIVAITRGADAGFQAMQALAQAKEAAE